MPVQWMSPDEALAELSAAHQGRLATVLPDGQPYITPVNCVVVDGKICFHSRKRGKKHDAIAANPRVCFEITSSAVPSQPAGKPCACSTRYHSVLVFGTVEYVTDEAEKVRILNALCTHIAPAAKYRSVTAEESRTCLVLAITPTEISGKINYEPR